MSRKLDILARGRWILRCVAVLLCGAAFSYGVAGQLPQLVGYSVVDDFQGDGLGQWASYPPAQDIGYEPSVTPTSAFEAQGGRSLMRWVRPTRAGDLRMGFIKRFDLTVNGTSTLAFEYRVNALTSSPRIEIGAAGRDGYRYTREVAGVNNDWTKISANLGDLRRADGTPLGEGIRIEAIYLVARIPNASEDTTYRFLIDNVTLTGSKPASFEILAPSSSSVEPWDSAISARGFRPDEAVGLEVRSPVPLVRASAQIVDRTGKRIASLLLYDDGTHGDRAARDNVWTNDAAYKLGKNDSPSLWRAEIRGETAERRTVSTDLRFLIHSAGQRTHPHLYFGAGERSELVARTRDSRLAKVWEYIQTSAKNSRASGPVANGGDVFELLDSEYLLPSLLGYFDVLNRARSRIAYNAFVSYLTDDAEARKSAKETLLAVSNWQRWEPPWFTAHGQRTYYPAGLLAVDVALGYDLLYVHLTEAERSKIRRALIEKQIIPTYREYFLDNRAMANTSNWISHTVGGALIAASAIAGDVTPEEAGGKFDLYVNGLLMKIEAHMAASYLPDGSYGEGISYQEFDLETLSTMIAAVDRAFGIDYWNTTHVKDSLRYALYTRTAPRDASLDMGDTHPPAGFGISPLIYLSKDPVMRWYYSKFDRPSLQHFIFYDDSVQPTSPDSAGIPDSTIFEDKGNAVFRTGWDEDSIAMLFRAGPNFNHHHGDQGSFLITAFGEPLVTEAGWSDYYKDPFYASFFTQAVGHNTVLVAENPESQVIPDTPQFKALNAYPRITASVTSEFYDGVGSDLTSVYPDGLERYTRRIVFVKPYYFIVYDDLKSANKRERFDFLLHLPNRAGVKVEGTTAVYQAPKAALAVRSFTPEGAKLSVENGRIPYPIFSARTPAETPPQPAYLKFSTLEPSSEMQFLTAVVPAKTAAGARDLVGKMFPIPGDNMKGIRADRGSETDIVMFHRGTKTASMRHDGWVTDASVLILTNNGSNLKTLGAQNVCSVTDGNRTMLSAEAPISMSANYGPDQVSVTVNSGVAAKIVLFVGIRPVRIELDGKEIGSRSFTYDQPRGSIVFAAPAGQHEMRIRLK